MHDALVNVGENLFASVLFAALVFVAGLLYIRWGSRRLFCMRDPSRVTVVVSGSATTNTGTYRRSSTGIGQVRALGDLAPRFAYAYWRRRLDQVFTSDAELMDRVGGDLIVLGGEKNNTLTLELLEEFARAPGFPVTASPASTVEWNGVVYASEGDGDRLKTDYGLIVRCANPFSTGTPFRALVIAGASTHGVHAASKSFTSDRWFRGRRDLVALVRCRVHDGFPVQISIVERAVRDPSGTWMAA